MATVQITSKNFGETLKKGGIVLLDWWAPWCGPCRAFGPIYERVAAANTDVVFGKVNTEEEPELAGEFNINSIPTLMIIRDGTVLFARPSPYFSSRRHEEQLFTMGILFGAMVYTSNSAESFTHVSVMCLCGLDEIEREETKSWLLIHDRP
jgi:thioredoxin 1